MVSTFEPVFRTGKCLGFVSCTHLELDTNGTPSAPGGRCVGAAGGGGGHEAHRDGGALAPRQRDRSRRRRGTAAPEESGRRGKGWDEFPTEILGGAVEFCAGAANLESFESSGFRWDVFNKITQYLSCPNLFSL